jgi:hypothetical protein
LGKFSEKKLKFRSLLSDFLDSKRVERLGLNIILDFLEKRNFLPTMVKSRTRMGYMGTCLLAGFAGHALAAALTIHSASDSPHVTNSDSPQPEDELNSQSEFNPQSQFNSEPDPLPDPQPGPRNQFNPAPNFGGSSPRAPNAVLPATSLLAHQYQALVKQAMLGKIGEDDAQRYVDYGIHDQMWENWANYETIPLVWELASVNEIAVNGIVATPNITTTPRAGIRDGSSLTGTNSIGAMIRDDRTLGNTNNIIFSNVTKNSKGSSGNATSSKESSGSDSNPANQFKSSDNNPPSNGDITRTHTTIQPITSAQIAADLLALTDAIAENFYRMEAQWISPSSQIMIWDDKQWLGIAMLSTLKPSQSVLLYSILYSNLVSFLLYQRNDL